MGYQPHEPNMSASGYVAPKLARPLRTGAEVSLILILLLVTVDEFTWTMYINLKMISFIRRALVAQ